jgi:hypothetical protein
MKAPPFLIQADASGETLQPIEDRERVYDEYWLQELLRKHPDILPVAEIEPVFSPLVPIGREVVTDTGAIDNLFISHRGYLVLVETKLWRNPEAKREVVAQAIDYASSVSKWNYSKLDEVAREYTKKYENAEIGLVDLVEGLCGPVEGGHYFFEETAAKNLRLGRFLTLIVGDRIRHSVVEMLDYVNKYPHLATDVALVELICYRWTSVDDWPLLVVPNLVARTEIVERSVVQVTLKPDGSYQVDARQERAEERGRGRRRVTLSEEAFWELLMEHAPEDYEAAHRLLEYYRENDAVTIDPAEGSVVVRLDIQDTGQQASLFFIRKQGTLHVWAGVIGNQLEKAGLPRGLVDVYEAQVKDIFQLGRDRKEVDAFSGGYRRRCLHYRGGCAHWENTACRADQ